MSHAATNWAIEQRGRISPHALTLLISLADFENGQSGKCCPTRRAIEKDCGMPVRSITRYTKELVECGLVVVEELKREDGSICANQFHLTYRSTRRGQTVDTPGTERPTPDQKELGVVQNMSRGGTVSGQQKEQPRKRTPEENISFERFWEVWPRKKAKGAAEKAWAKLSVDDQRAAIDAPKPEGDPKYIPHPATWLNAKRWLDEPDPSPVAKDPKALAEDEEFQSFYKAFPRHDGEWDAALAFGELSAEEKAAAIAAAPRYAELAKSIEPKYVKTPAAWLNAGRWRDEAVSGPSAQASTLESELTLWAQRGGPPPEDQAFWPLVPADLRERATMLANDMRVTLMIHDREKLSERPGFMARRMATDLADGPSEAVMDFRLRLATLESALGLGITQQAENG